jgi:hypothetical protein
MVAVESLKFAIASGFRVFVGAEGSSANREYSTAPVTLTCTHLNSPEGWLELASASVSVSATLPHSTRVACQSLGATVSGPATVCSFPKRRTGTPRIIPND